MKLSMPKYYRKWDHFQRYIITNEKRAREIERLYSLNRKYFRKTVLDVACGGGILGFLVESKGHSYTGIDINPDMIMAANSRAKETNSRCKFILGDAQSKSIPGRYDTITCIGNALTHLTTNEFLAILRNLNRNAMAGSYFVIDYRDTVDLLFTKTWRYRLTVQRKPFDRTTKTIITTGCSTVKGEIYQDAFVKGKILMKAKQTIWSPFILEPLMKSQGWNPVNRKSAEWKVWTDIYQKKRLELPAGTKLA